MRIEDSGSAILGKDALGEGLHVGVADASAGAGSLHQVDVHSDFASEFAHDRRCGNGEVLVARCLARLAG